MIKKIYINRELSWLEFNARVLQEAADQSVPLIERLRFIGIFSNNLDEFFKVRYASIKRIDMAGKGGKKELGGIRAKELLVEITNRVIELQSESAAILSKIQKQLETENIFFINETQVSTSQQEFLNSYFIEMVSPVLSTFMLDEMDEFPLLKDSAAYLVITMTMKKDDEKHYALIEIPKIINRFVELPKQDDKQYIILLDDLIRNCLDNIFSIFDYSDLRADMIKITRDAELDFDSDLSKSFVDKISKSVENRKTGTPVRIVYDEKIEKETLDYLLQKMEISISDSIIPGGRYHNRRDYMSFPSLGRQNLLYKPFKPLLIKGFSLEGSLFNTIAQKDYLLHTPYQTFSYVIRFLREAALDPKVKSIKITIYRLAQVSHIASSLINAAKNGKKVTVQIELQARFDEAANIRYAEQMQNEGVHLIYGIPRLKVHCKVCLIERIESNKIKRYGLISTGNFNESTAKVYTDYTLFTADQKILKDIGKIFDFLEINYKIGNYKHLIVSPHYTRNIITELIQTEIDNNKEGKPSGIKLKLNSLSDFKIIDKLYEASMAGVKIQLIVRGVCCLIPGVKGMSENIEIISIIDKFLEHPRIFIFKNEGDEKLYISSADFMSRNLDNRVEVACPIYDQEIKQEIKDSFNICWSDNVKARIFSQEHVNAYRETNPQKIRSQFETYSYYLNK